MPYAPRAHKPRHAAAPTKRVDRRASAAERGYDSRWAKLRAYYVRRHPLCEDCLPHVTPCHEVDHIIPITGITDPLRLDEENLRSRCRRHHAAKTARYDDEVRSHYQRHGKDATLERYREVMRRAD